jgi:hypothetical protein
MPERTAPDKLTQIIWLCLAVLGGALAVIGWYRYVS